MASADQYAAWIVKNADKKGTPEFDTVAKAYKAAKTGIQVAPTTPDASSSTVEDPSVLRSVGKSVRDLAAGAVRGAGSIGATIVAPGDTLVDYVKGDRKGGESRNEERRRKMDEGLHTMTGANTDSMAYGAGKLAAEVAGTFGASGAAGNALVRLAPRAAPLATSLASGGMQTGMAPGIGNALTRVIGGAGSGALMSGMVDPENIGTGAAIGAAIPGIAMAGNKLLPLAGKATSEIIGGMGTRTGGESIRQAAKAGYQGGKNGRVFSDNLRGNVPMTDVLDSAKANLAKMYQVKSAEYRAGMAQVSGDKTVLAFDGIDDAVAKAADVTGFKGQVKNKAADKVRRDILETVNEWKALNPGEYHTPEGFDALKQRIGGIVESIPMEERTAQMVGKDIYRSVQSSITNQAPVYAKVMKDYSAASAEISEIERALSLGKKASVDTAMRKLQSLTRNNVNTNYGNRVDLAETLANKGGNDLMPALSGQALNSWMPRGLGNAVAGGMGLGGYAVGGAGLAAPILAVQSPRLMGEAAYKAGQAAREVNKLTRLLGPSVYKTAPVVVSDRLTEQRQ